MPRRATSTSFGGKAGNPRNTTIPGTGAPPEVFRRRMALLASRAKTVKQVEEILDDKDHQHFMRALEYATDRGYGKEAQPLDGELTIRIVEGEENA